MIHCFFRKSTTKVGIVAANFVPAQSRFTGKRSSILDEMGCKEFSRFSRRAFHGELRRGNNPSRAQRRAE